MEMLTGTIAFFLMTAIIDGINLEKDPLTRLPLRQLVGEQTVVAVRAQVNACSAKYKAMVKVLKLKKKEGNGATLRREGCHLRWMAA